MSAAVSIYIYHHTPSGQSRLYRVTQLRTDGVHYRESVVSEHKHCSVLLLYILCILCVSFPSILDIKFVGRTSRGHTGGRSHRISHPPSFCGACLHFSREKDSAIPFPRRPWSRIFVYQRFDRSPLVGCFIIIFLVRKIPFTRIELTSQRVIRGWLWATGATGRTIIKQSSNNILLRTQNSFKKQLLLVTKYVR